MTTFTAHDDAALIEMRTAGISWPEVSARLGRPASTLSCRLTRIAPGLVVKTGPIARRAGKLVVEQEERHGPQQRDMDSMPPFHDVSWSAIWLPIQAAAGEDDEGGLVQG